MKSTYIIIRDDTPCTPSEIIAMVYDAWRETPDEANDKGPVWVKSISDAGAMQLAAGQAALHGVGITPLDDVDSVVVFGPTSKTLSCIETLKSYRSDDAQREGETNV